MTNEQFDNSLQNHIVNNFHKYFNENYHSDSN
jgi:hypothetical protein